MPSNSLGPFFSPLNLSSSFLMSAPPATSIRRNLASSSHSLMAILRSTARWHAIARLNLRCMPMPIIDPQLRDKEDLLSASITLDDAKPLYLEYQAAGVAFHQTLGTEP